MGDFGAQLSPWDTASGDSGVENEQQGEGSDSIGLGLGVTALLCFMVGGAVGVGAPGVRVGLVKLSQLGSVLLADRTALISHYRARAVFRP